MQISGQGDDEHFPQPSYKTAACLFEMASFHCWCNKDLLCTMPVMQHEMLSIYLKQVPEVGTAFMIGMQRVNQEMVCHSC